MIHERWGIPVVHGRKHLSTLNTTQRVVFPMTNRVLLL